MKMLVIDVGGTRVRILASGQAEARRLSSGPKMTAALRRLGKLPAGCRKVDNGRAFEGGFRFWQAAVPALESSPASARAAPRKASQAPAPETIPETPARPATQRTARASPGPATRPAPAAGTSRSDTP